MILIYRVFLKIHHTLNLFYQKANVKVAIWRGMKVGINLNTPDKVYFGTEPFLIEIGDNVNIAGGVRFVNHGGTVPVLRKIKGYEDCRILGRIKIGNNTTIGLNSIITQDVQIGNNCILGGGSVLSQSMPDNTVFVGNPAQYLCSIEELGDVVLKNSPNYPRELDKNRPELEKWMKEHLPYKYKKTRKI